MCANIYLTERAQPQLIVSLFTLALAGRYLERVWGSQELLRFTLVVVVVSNIIAVIVNWAESFVFTDPMHVLCVSFLCS